MTDDGGGFCEECGHLIDNETGVCIVAECKCECDAI